MKPFTLSIAGFDPSGGAGVLADVKTFQAHGVTGFGCCTAITYQNENEVDGVKWLSFEEIKRQLEPLFRKYSIQYIKIGVIESLAVLEQVVNFLLSKNPEVKIIWDPVVKASAGFLFQDSIDKKKLENICKKIFLLTPNLLEFEMLMPGEPKEKTIGEMTTWCNILLKGGHGTGKAATDVLYAKSGIIEYRGNRLNNDKHGTGCVLSAAISSNLAKGEGLQTACALAKSYIKKFISSEEGLLGVHRKADL